MATTAISRKAPAAPAAGELTHRQILTILAGLLMGMFLAALDQTIVSTAIRTIADELQGLDRQAWVTTAYLITSTISTPLYGKLSDIYGRKGFFLFAIGVFVLGSLACSFSTSMIMLAVFRAIQGIGAGGLMSLALAIIGDIVAPRDRARYQGYFVAVFGSSSVLGPVIGGFFAGRGEILGITGWRWVFLINVPLGLLAMLVVWRTLHLQHRRLDHRIDWWGAVTLIVGLVPLLVVAEQGRDWGWGSATALTCYVVGVLGVLAFIVVEWRMKNEALIPLRLFRNRAIGVSLLASVIIGLAMFGAMMMLPLYMQIVHGASPMMSGFMMLPMVAGMMTMSIVVGILISRTGVVRPFPLIGIIIVAIVSMLLSRISADTPLWHVMVEMFFVGAGIGMCNQPMTLIVQSAADRREIGVATSAATTFRQLGGTLGVAIFLSLLFSTVADHIKNNLTDAAKTPAFLQALKGAVTDPKYSQQSDPAAHAMLMGLVNPRSGAAMPDISKDSSVLTRLPHDVAHPFLQGFAQSMDKVFLCAAVIAALGAVVLLFMPKIELRSSSPAAEAARDMTQHLEPRRARRHDTRSEGQLEIAEDHTPQRLLDFNGDPVDGEDAAELVAAGTPAQEPQAPRG